MSDKYLKIAKEIIEVVGKDNILSATHCATRLRLIVKDKNAINNEEVEKIFIDYLVYYSENKEDPILKIINLYWEENNG